MLMVLHMLRRDLGDAAFVSGLQAFYRDNLFQAAGIDDLREAFEQQSGRNLAAWFNARINRTGAPILALSQVQSQPLSSGYRITGRVAQTQGVPFPLSVPILVHQDGGDPVVRRISLDEGSADFEIEVLSRPIRLAVDPSFDVFRQLVDGESPSALSKLFGADQGLILLPSAASGRMADEYSQLARAWANGHQGWRILDDDVIDVLPDDRSVWLKGWNNRFLNVFGEGQSAFGLEPDAKTVMVGDDKLDGVSTSLVLTRDRV